MSREQILIVDDEPDISELVGMYLDREGFRFQAVTTGADALALAPTLQPQLIILDVQLPDMEGYELCAKLRQTTSAPILFLTCKDTETDMVVGLSVGGDDFVSKPFSPVALLARIKAHLRRSKLSAAAAGNIVDKSWLGSGALRINTMSHEVMLNGEPVELSAKEFQLLALLISHPKQVLSFQQIMDRIWGYHSETETKTLQVHIGTLRKKIEKNPAKPASIINVRGIGYKYHEQQA